MRISDWSSDVCSSDLGFDAPFSADMIRPKRIAMFSSLRKLFKSEPDPREARRPLWNAVVAAARAPHWYAEGGVPDTDRQSVVSGKSVSVRVDLGGRRIIKKKKNE